MSTTWEILSWNFLSGRFCQSKVSDSMFISLDVHRFEDHKDGIITWSGPCRETTLLFVHVFPCSGLDISVGLQNLPVRIVNRGFRKFNLAHLSKLGKWYCLLYHSNICLWSQSCILGLLLIAIIGHVLFVITCSTWYDKQYHLANFGKFA